MHNIGSVIQFVKASYARIKKFLSGGSRFNSYIFLVTVYCTEGAKLLIEGGGGLCRYL